ncbi:MAG: GspH/FimT family pseudopilin [Thiogranum sp.]|nr:GspH/FimT family pseudopilin [Thiogranum sp.]
MNRQHGFTLVELMITLAVATILLTVAIPSFTETIKNNRIVTQANELVGTLNFARSEAVKSAITVNVCVSSNGTSCAGGTDWSQGWLVWVDTDNSGGPENGEQRKVVKGLPNSMTLNSTVTQVQYTAQGAAGINGTFTLCDDRAGETGRQITISNTGRANVSPQPCA